MRFLSCHDLTSFICVNTKTPRTEYPNLCRGVFAVGSICMSKERRIE
nr:MAG TPA: hypothetical protein [Caudoviricetes sp.]